MSTVIRAKGVGKRYSLTHRKEPYLTLRDTVTEGIRNFLHRGNRGIPREDFWALSDLSFEVKEGERIGIIGRNGAGKSTLLKILSRITEPTTGRIELKGRVASLLEVGTGFHPELTGQENIFLNGAILGMTTAEIRRKFDEIVSFAEVERFLDTPVKRYSSGMYVRLAFAVAAHMEPDILIVDEVLAVGDAQFQKKCLGKMEDVGKEGRTVIFVSHNMAAINQLCTSAMYLKGGKLVMYAPTQEAVSTYMTSGAEMVALLDLAELEGADRTGVAAGNFSLDKKARFRRVGIRNTDKVFTQNLSMGDTLQVIMELEKRDPDLRSVRISMEIKSSDGIRIANIVDVDSHFTLPSLDERQVISLTLPDIRLYPDTYYLTFWVGAPDASQTYEYVEDCLSFTITDSGNLTTRSLPRSAGLFFFTPEWQKESLSLLPPLPETVE